MKRLAILTVLGLLTACNSPEAEDETTQATQAGKALTLPAPSDPLSADELAQLEAGDCRTVAEAYFDAVTRQDFGFAEEFWDDPVIDGARLEALFTGYRRPVIEIVDVMEEGAAGTLYCTVTGALADTEDPERPMREGEIVLTRVNDVPGATAEQLRWRIDSSTFIEPMQRARRAESV